VVQLAGPINGSAFGPGVTTITYGLAGGAGTLLVEDFSDNSAGWSLGPEWQIGPAASSFCAAGCTGNDPDTDHSLTTDNGVAGMNIGGCVSTTMHGFSYLTSPSMNATNVSGTLTLEFWRHLHGDHTPFMQHHVQVFDGTSWVTVWEHLPTTCINDADWTQQVIDVSAFANAAFAVRFGQAVGQSGAFNSGGWNVDDVHVYTGTGLGAQCSFTVTVLPNTDPGPFTCGAITLPTDPGQCTRTRSNVPMTNAFTGCALDSIQVLGPAQLPVGTTTLTYTGWSNGASLGTCSSSVTIVDEELPVIACGGAVLLTADAGTCEATNVVLTLPAASDNCTIASLTSDHTGTTFGTGTTLVTWTAVDAAGNSTQCTQSVTVTGNTGTSVVTGCSGDTTLLADPLTCDVPYTYTAPELVSNCVTVPLSLLSGLPSGSAFPAGANTVTYGTTGIVFDEDFSDNAAGWTLGPEWQIGPAQPSACAVSSVGDDPALDHSTTPDNGVAGMVIGGCVSTAIHPAHRLTSPVVDVSGVSGTLTLSFWRHLHGDYLPYMDHTVQVFDGTNWITIWSHTAQVELNDADWTAQSFDVTAYKNAFFQVRFGQSVGANGAFTSGGWSIDDVQLLSGSATACTFTVTVITPTTYADTDGDGLGDPGAPSTQCPAPPGHVANNGDACPLLLGTIGDPCDDGDPLTQNDVIDATCTCSGEGVVRVALKALLDGPYNAGTGRMDDALRSLGLVPTTQPYGSAPFGYTGSETVAPTVLVNTDPDDAVVDWVLVELRDAVTPSLILHRRAALLQRDGDVVDTDGSSPVTFATPAAAFHVALRHRNHFGAMTATPLPLSGTPTAIDLTSAATSTWGTNARKPPATAGPMLLWSGNARTDSLLRYTGALNDRDGVLLAVGGFIPTAVVNDVYDTEDCNLDGDIKYTGSSNDREPILININWGLAGTSATRQRFEQLP
jgi:hypothetical protein